jgi:hypothetical protein
MIKTVKFKFKRINQEATPHYRQPVPVTDGSVDGITRTVAPGMTLTRALPSAPALTSTSPRRVLPPPFSLMELA